MTVDGRGKAAVSVTLANPVARCSFSPWRRSRRHGTLSAAKGHAMAQPMFFDVAERRREKELARERDLARISRAEVSPEAVRDANGLFSAFDPAQARVVARRMRVRL